MAIKDIPLEDRPREKALRKGIDSLTNSELLALIIGSGNGKKDVLEIAREIVKNYPSLNVLSSLELDEIKKIYGISEATGLKIQASLILGRRLNVEKISNFTSNDYKSINLYNYYQHVFIHFKSECLIALLINRIGIIIKEKLIAKGSKNCLNFSLNNLCDVLTSDVTKVVLLHNHLTASCSPSNYDIEATIILEDELQKIDIKLFDHLIISTEDYFSFRDNKLLKNN